MELVLHTVLFNNCPYHVYIVSMIFLSSWDSPTANSRSRMLIIFPSEPSCSLVCVQ